MDFVGLLRAFFALTIVVGLIMGLAYLARRYAPQLMAMMSAQRAKRRLEVVETLVLDPARRLVLVRLDNKERLLLLGEGRELSVAPSPSDSVAHPTSAPPKGDAADDPVKDLF